MSSSLAGLLAFIAIGYAAVCLLLYLTQERSIFFRVVNDSALSKARHAERFEISVPGATLEGWWIENPNATSRATILYFGGNAEDVLHTASTAQQINASHMIVANYRGYGGSTGAPGQKALYDDGLALYEHAIRKGVPPEQIVVMGRSLGSAVASMLAGTRPVRAAILITPFDSLAAVAAHHYPWLPVRWLLRHPFPSVEWAANAQAPALLLAAEHDNVVPVPHARALFEAWRGPKQMHVLEGRGHNDIETHPDYYRLINEFLAGSGVAARRDI